MPGSKRISFLLPLSQLLFQEFQSLQLLLSKTTTTTICMTVTKAYMVKFAKKLSGYHKMLKTRSKCRFNTLLKIIDLQRQKLP